MKNRNTSSRGSVRPLDPDRDAVATLVRSAGPRATPDTARMERARAMVQAEWRTVLANRRRTRWQWVAAAAVIVLAIAAGLAVFFRAQAPVMVARVMRVTGDVLVRDVEGKGLAAKALVTGADVTTGTEIDTGASGRALLQWTSGSQLRLDQHSLVQLKSVSELRLARGAVYVEIAPQSTSASQLVVSTPFGQVRHVGTRFEVRVADGQARVRVRDGIASFANTGQSPVMIRAGQQLSVAAAGVLKLEPGPGFTDSAWEWVREIAPSFAIEGRSLFDALEWLSGESGLRIVYAGEEARAQARTVILRGTIEGLDTQKALLAVLTGSGLAFEVYPDRVEIRSRETR